MINIIFESSDRIVNGRTSHSILAYLIEEVGELSTEINIQTGYTKRQPGADGILGEAIDVILCAIDLIKVNYPDITEEELKQVVKEKCCKWESNYAA